MGQEPVGQEPVGQQQADTQASQTMRQSVIRKWLNRNRLDPHLTRNQRGVVAASYEKGSQPTPTSSANKTCDV